MARRRFGGSSAIGGHFIEEWLREALIVFIFWVIVAFALSIVSILLDAVQRHFPVSQSNSLYPLHDAMMEWLRAAETLIGFINSLNDLFDSHDTIRAILLVVLLTLGALPLYNKYRIYV